MDDSRLGKLNYQYDPIGRLIKSQNPYSSESFSFDPAGNLIDPIATQAAQVKNNLISQYQGKHYKYDAQGNVIETTQAGQTLKLTWDNLNRLIQSDNNGQITDYGYDVFGRRLFKNNQTDHSLTLFGWDGDLMIWESYQVNQNQSKQQDYTKHYIYEPNSFVPLLQTGYTGFIKLIETPDYRQFQNVPYSIYKDPVWKTETRKNKAELERVAFYHCDQVGTPQTLSNEIGECVWEIKQDTWGTALEINTSDNLLEQTNLRFQGQYYDKETGLHYNRYRYYEPYSARYVSKDPIGLFGGLHSTKYVSDPNQWVDPMGLQDKKIDLRLNDKAAWDRYVARQKADLIELKAIGERPKQKGKETQLAKSKWGVSKVSDYWIGQQEIYNPNGVNLDQKVQKKEFSGMMGANSAINDYKKRNGNFEGCSRCFTLDYITGSVGKGPFSFGVSLNTHNNDIFISPINVSMQGGKNLYMEVAQRAFSLASDTMFPFSTSIGFGHIFNMEDTKRANGTSAFLTGEAVTISGTIPRLPISIGATTSTDSLKSDLSHIYKKPIGAEISLTNGKGVDITRSNSIPLEEVVNKVKNRLGLGD